MDFWHKSIEVKFFKEALKNFASPAQLFYQLDGAYLAYAPKGKCTKGYTLQARNALIGRYTENWSANFLQPIANRLGLYAVHNVVCPALGLTNVTCADIAFCTTKEHNQPSQNIKLIFEIKMSIVNNYRFTQSSGELSFIGDYSTHKGVPSILRSDSMLKAIGKAINIRIAGAEAAHMPIIVLGNSPISNSYSDKVDRLKQAGIIQSFVSIYPKPTEKALKVTPLKAFQTFDDYAELETFLHDLVRTDMHFFSAMISKKRLSKLITIAAKQATETAKAEKFLELLKKIGT